MIAEKDPYIKSAYDQLQIISQDKQKRMEYEAREKAIRDHDQFLYEAEQRGIKLGEQRGIKLGEQRGMKLGEQRGMKLGGQRINQLNEFLMRDNRIDDLKRSICDAQFQRQLLDEYGL